MSKPTPEQIRAAGKNAMRKMRAVSKQHLMCMGMEPTCGDKPENWCSLCPRRDAALLKDDAAAIERALESAIQCFGAGRLAKALVAAGANDNLQTLADYADPATCCKQCGRPMEPGGICEHRDTRDSLHRAIASEVGADFHTPHCALPKPSHEEMMAGYAVACRFKVYESQAFKLAEEMWHAFRNAGVTVVQPQQEAELDAEIDKAWQQWSVAGNVMYRQGFINAVNSLARDADGVPVLGESQQQEKTK